MFTSMDRLSCRMGGWLFAVVLLGSWSLVGVAIGKDGQGRAAAERLVDRARQAEVEGDTARQFALLRKAIRVAPDHELARWQLGQLKVGDDWMPVEDAQRVAAANPKQAEYQELRALHGDSLDAQLVLARWCDKNGLDEEARFHWASVLDGAAGNEEALRALGMWMYEGRPMTPAEIAQAKKQAARGKAGGRPLGADGDEVAARRGAGPLDGA